MVDIRIRVQYGILMLSIYEVAAGGSPFPSPLASPLGVPGTGVPGMGTSPEKPPEVPTTPPYTQEHMGIAHTIGFHITPCTCRPDTKGMPTAFCRQDFMHLVRPWHTHGICVMYHGIFAYTDLYGYVTFAKDHPGNTVDIVVTPFMFPVLGIGTVVDHWQCPPETPCHMYRAVYQSTPEGSASWTITPFTQTRIPDDAVIILAHPQTLQVPTGHLRAEVSHNLLLPPLCYQVPSGDFTTPDAALLQTLKYLHYVRPVHPPLDQLKTVVRTYAPYQHMA